MNKPEGMSDEVWEDWNSLTVEQQFILGSPLYYDERRKELRGEKAMTKYPITDPKEIAALEDGWHISVKRVYLKMGDEFHLGGYIGSSAITSDLIAVNGGITDRLVPQSELDEVREKLAEAYELLEESSAFIGYQASVGELVDRVDAWLAANAKEGS